MAGPRYAKIEFCRSVATLWGKLESERWDWLGVHRNGQFVLGSPRASRGTQLIGHPSLLWAGATEGDHGVRVDTVDGGGSTDWLPSEAEAIEDYKAKLEELASGSGPALFRVRRLEKTVLKDEQFVVRNPVTYM